MSQIFCFGASITHGYADTQGGWPARLREFLWQKDQDGFNFYNLGIPVDETSREVASRLDNELKVRQGSEKPNLVIFSIGTNDSEYFNDEKKFKVSIKEFEKNINKCIKIARKYSERIVFMDLVPVVDAKVDPIPWCPERSYRNKYIWEYREILKNICIEEKVYFIDAYDRLLASSDYMHSLGDGVHPNDIGHEILFEIIKDYLEEKKLI